MKRREFIALAGITAVWPLVARSQQKAMPVIGWLDATGAYRGPSLAAFREGLSEIGYVEGQNVAIEYGLAEGHYDRLPALAADLVRRKVDVIVAAGGPAPTLAAKNATSTTPIVFTGVSDPVAAGLVASLARPGGNITGFAILVVELAAKRLELISELTPQADIIALLVNPSAPTPVLTIPVVEEAARAKGLQLHVLKASTETEIDAAFASLIQRRAAALLVAADPFFESRRDKLVALASGHAVPAFYPFREYVTSGGLISYGVNLVALERQVGTYVGRIPKGTKPADLPVQQPTKFELVINLNTARQLGITVPQSLLQRADEVIE